MHGTIRWSPHDDKTRAIHTRNDTHTKDPNMIPLSSVGVFTLGVILSRIAKKKLTPTSVCVYLCPHSLSSRAPLHTGKNDMTR